jgi:TolB-like protein
MIGRTLGHYRILSKLGEGGMGTVWKAQHTLLPDRIVALKLLAENLWDSSEARQRFLQEARAVTRLDHAGIAPLHEVGEDDGVFYIVFKFIEGVTAAQATEAGPLSPAEAVAIAADAADALAHAHARGVLHRDVTAGNLMVTPGGRGVLVDFGLALAGAETRLTRTGTAMGTPAYLAPEVLRGQPAEARSDLYGLGVALYRMLTGRLPFTADVAETLLYQALNERARPPSELRPGVPTELDDLVLRLLEKRAEDRYASAEQLLVALRKIQRLPAIISTAPASARPSPLRRWLHGLRRWLRGRAGRRSLAGAAAVALATVAIAIAWQRGWRPGFMNPHIPVVAVLPARNASPDPEETAYLAEGLGEEIVSRLSEVSGIRVLPWGTTRRFADPARPMKAVADELQAEALLVTSYQSDGERIRVNVGLVDGRSGTQRWSQSYEEKAEDLFAVQRDIAEGVASRFKRQLSQKERTRLAEPPSSNPEAYDYFIRGADYLRAYDAQSVRLAQPFFEKALALDPDLAEAWVGLGALTLDRYYRGDAGDAELAESERCFRRALALSPDLASAYHGLVRVYTTAEKREDALQLARDLAHRRPDDLDALVVQGWAYALSGLAQKAIPIFDRVLELSPADQRAAFYRVIAESWSGQWADCAKHAKAYIARFGEDGEIYTFLAGALTCEGNLDEARQFFERALQMLEKELSYVAAVGGADELYRRLGLREQRRALAAKWKDVFMQGLAAHPDNHQLLDEIPGLCAALGQTKEIERMADGVIQGDATAGGALRVALALGELGEKKRALEVLRAARGGDVAGYSVYFAGCAEVQGRGWEALQGEPEFKALHAAVQARLDELAARY